MSTVILEASVNAEGLLTFFDSDGDNSAQAAKASPGRLYGWSIHNPNGTDYFIQFFDAAAGDVTVGTTTPKLSIMVNANDNNEKVFPAPISFDTAITYACTTTATGSSDPATGFVVNLFYK